MKIVDVEKWALCATPRVESERKSEGPDDVEAMEDGDDVDDDTDEVDDDELDEDEDEDEDEADAEADETLGPPAKPGKPM